MKVLPKCYHCQMALRSTGGDYSIDSGVGVGGGGGFYARHDYCEKIARYHQGQVALHKLHCHLDNCPNPPRDPFKTFKKRRSLIGIARRNL